ncbi:MAG: hypothetical protein M9939_24420 [Mesorhizobium sp.]|nr:hypothetical protein [Mesorhizobium sp.]MCO5164246.1 hypothetical protein [Mesorhizobium sp.]
MNGELLQPICETVITRSASELALKDGTRAELALDVGEIHAEGRSAALREVEIELIEGGLARLFDIPHALFADGGLRFSRLTKSARGYLLAEQGYVDPPLVPRNAQEVALDPTQNAERAARDIFRECLGAAPGQRDPAHGERLFCDGGARLPVTLPPGFIQF